MTITINHNGVEKEPKMIYVNHNGVDKVVAGAGGGGLSFSYYETRSATSGVLPSTQELPPFESGDIFIVSLGSGSISTPGWDNVVGNVWVADTNPGPSVEVTPDPGNAFSVVVVKGSSGIGQTAAWSGAGQTIRLPGFDNPRAEGAMVLAFTYSPTNVNSYDFSGPDFQIRLSRNSQNPRQYAYFYIPISPGPLQDHTTELTATKSGGSGTSFTSRLEVLPK